MEVKWKNFMGGYLNACAKYNPNGVFIIFDERRVTWRELNQRVNRLATALKSLGVKKGDKVTFMFRNRPEFFEVNYAVQKAGGIPVPMNYRFTPREIEFQADHSDAVVFLAEDLWWESVEQARAKLPRVRHFIHCGSGRPKDTLDYEELMADHPPVDPEVPVAVDEVCVICYTGGTTGRPKGVMLTYRAHLKMMEYLSRDMLITFAKLKLSPDKKERIAKTLPFPGLGPALDFLGSPAGQWLVTRETTQKVTGAIFRWMVGNPLLLRQPAKHDFKIMVPSFPFFHDASYQLVILCPLSGKATFVQPDMLHFDPVKVFKMVERERPQVMANVPTAWKLLVESPEIGNYDLGSVVIAASGAGINPAALKKKILHNFKNSLMMDLFGQTEMTPATSMRVDSDAGSLKDRSVGRPIIQTKVVDEQGREVPRGQTGEIIYKSDTIMKGYYKEEDKTAEVFKDGWFHSGDLGYVDEDGEIRVVERKKECISSGGEKIFPHEVEEIIGENPKVKDVCVLGVPDETWGHTVRAVVVLRDGEQTTAEEIMDWCRDRMAGYKKPRSVVFAEELPISPAGKLQRNLVRERFGRP